ncbi:MAG: glycosyltransferase family 39 protein [Phycisphaerae bacterium]|nr:glycosyltransferase family 39 protein [Phycisphaerae bacterium]
MQHSAMRHSPFAIRHLLFVICCLALAALLRIPGLETVPPPLNQDEASRGYDAWAILETGADRHGQRWPFFLESFGPGDYTAALTTYLTVPFVAVLGPTPLAMRLPDAIFGVLTVVLLYSWLRRQVDATVALLAAAILACDPWHIALSRTAHESGFAPFFLTFAMLALYRAGLMPGANSEWRMANSKWRIANGEARIVQDSAIRNSQLAVCDSDADAAEAGEATGAPGAGDDGARAPSIVNASRDTLHEIRFTRHGWSASPWVASRWSLIAGVMFAAHAWVYPATRLFTPLFCLALVVIYREHYLAMLRSGGARRTVIFALLGLLIGATPLIFTVFTHPEYLAARSGATLLIHQNLPVTGITWGFIRNFAANLDPRYLFFQCDEMSGASIPGVGLHLPVLAPLFLIGLIRVVGRARHDAWSRLLATWFVLYPLPAAICADWNPHPMRTVGGMVLFPILAASGGQWLIAGIATHCVQWRRPAMVIAAIAVAANLAHFANAYYREFPLVARPGYQTAVVEAIQYASAHAGDADFVLVTNVSNQPYIYALLYEPIPPRELATTEWVVADGRRGFHQVLRVGKYCFGPLDDVNGAVNQFRDILSRLPDDAEGLIIYVERPGQTPPGEVLSVLERIKVDDPRAEGQVFAICRWRPRARIR